jgi:hypothetical protein
MQFNDGKLNGNVHMGRVIKTPETSNPSAFLSAKLRRQLKSPEAECVLRVCTSMVMTMMRKRSNFKLL